MHSCAQVLKRDSDDVLRSVLDFEVVRRRRGRPKMTRRQVIKQVEDIGLNKEDAIGGLRGIQGS